MDFEQKIQSEIDLCDALFDDYMEIFDKSVPGSVGVDEIRRLFRGVWRKGYVMGVERGTFKTLAEVAKIRGLADG